MVSFKNYATSEKQFPSLSPPGKSFASVEDCIAVLLTDGKFDFLRGLFTAKL